MPSAGNAQVAKLAEYGAFGAFSSGEKFTKSFEFDEAYGEELDDQSGIVLDGAELAQGNTGEEKVTMNNATSTSAGVLGGDAAAEETAPSESGTGSSTSGGHPASAKYGVGTAVGYERTNAASGNESKNGEDIAMGDTESGFATAVGGKVDSTITLDGETTSGEAAHQVPGVAEHARDYAFGGEVDDTTTPFGDGEYSETTDAESSLPESNLGHQNPQAALKKCLVSLFASSKGFKTIREAIEAFLTLLEIIQLRKRQTKGDMLSQLVIIEKIVTVGAALSEHVNDLKNNTGKKYHGKKVIMYLICSNGEGSDKSLAIEIFLRQTFDMAVYFLEVVVAIMQGKSPHGLTPTEFSDDLGMLFGDLIHITGIKRQKGRKVWSYKQGKVLATEVGRTGEAWYDCDDEVQNNIELVGSLRRVVVQIMKMDFKPKPLAVRTKAATVTSGFGKFKKMEFGTLEFIDLSSVDLQ
ncbi:hypothetical protein LTR10_000552 [Elasticomyces elasticus]|nr:hypothetical protein LTR10_000552 [Elasticomyces elasticus]KAK4980200.1 hypothetical protein LTR42_000507 [Elasticomyces elasticus]